MGKVLYPRLTHPATYIPSPCLLRRSPFSTSNLKRTTATCQLEVSFRGKLAWSEKKARKITLKLLEPEAIKNTWAANIHYQTRQTQRAIANIPGSGLGDGNLLYGVGVVYLYPYSIESHPIGIKSYPTITVLSPGLGYGSILT
jgi:hypothetical protein